MFVNLSLVCFCLPFVGNLRLSVVAFVAPMEHTGNALPSDIIRTTGFVLTASPLLMDQVCECVRHVSLLRPPCWSFSCLKKSNGLAIMPCQCRLFCHKLSSVPFSDHIFYQSCDQSCSLQLISLGTYSHLYQSATRRGRDCPLQILPFCPKGTYPSPCLPIATQDSQYTLWCFIMQEGIFPCKIFFLASVGDTLIQIKFLYIES